MDDVTRDAAAPEGCALYVPGQLVAEERRGARVGRIAHAWDAEPPVLYRLAGATDPKPWIAWEHHLRLATDSEAAAYELQAGARPLAPQVDPR